ncbi:hypothetical protein Dimus_010760 [Dionaea muscipula]
MDAYNDKNWLKQPRNIEEYWEGTTNFVNTYQDVGHVPLREMRVQLSVPITVDELRVFLDLAEKDMRQINALFRELEVLKQKIKASRSKEEAESLKFTEMHLINKIYTESVEAKIPAVLEYLSTVIEAGCKFLIFAHHQPMIDSVYKFLQKKKVVCIRIDGTTLAASRQTMVADFQDRDN